MVLVFGFWFLERKEGMSLYPEVKIASFISNDNIHAFDVVEASLINFLSHGIDDHRSMSWQPECDRDFSTDRVTHLC